MTVFVLPDRGYHKVCDTREANACRSLHRYSSDRDVSPASLEIALSDKVLQGIEEIHRRHPNRR